MMLKRAWIYLRRKNKRSIILLLLLFIISCSISIGLSVWNNIGDAIKEVEQRMGTSIVLKLSQATMQDESHRVDLIDYDGEDTFGYGGPSLTDDMIQQILREVDGISIYNADNESYCHLSELKLVPGFWTHVRDEYQKDPDLVIEESYWPELRIMYAQCTSVFGNTDSSLDERFRTGTFELVEGRHLISEKDYRKVLVSDELAELNGLEIGDTFNVDIRSGFIKNNNPMDLWGDAIELEIIGIYHVNGYQPVGEWVFEDTMTYNYLFTDTDTIKHLYAGMFAENCNSFQELYYSNVTFFVDDPEQLPDILAKSVLCRKQREKGRRFSYAHFYGHLFI